MPKLGNTTRLVHSDRQRGVEHGAVRKPVHNSVQYGFDKTEDLIASFQGKRKGAFHYSRNGTPTASALEAKINMLEDGIGTITFSTGMAAIAATFTSLLMSGDHLIASKNLFANTANLLNTIKGFGIEVSLVDASDVRHVADQLKSNTRMVFVETISNPATEVPDLTNIGAYCQEKGLVYVVDNTITSPALFRPKDVGASLSINSLTKIIAGHGAALGGSVTDTGCYDWSDYPNIDATNRGDGPATWGLTQIRRKGLRDFGATLSPEQANLIALGMETLEMRIRHSSASAHHLAEFLSTQEGVADVRYPGLAGHPQHDLANAHFASSAWLLSFEFSDLEKMINVLDALELPVRATGLGDSRTLIIPVAMTIYDDLGPETRADMNIPDGLVRVSVGLEDIEDLIGDFKQAFAKS
ncbi:MAG: cystathionine gamma-synthase family protein [Sulfitobacter sp.]